VTTLVFLGMAMFIGLYGGYLNLEKSFWHSYKELKMADYWLALNPISQRALNEIRSIDGVDVEGRIVQDIQMSIPEHGRENLSVRVISLPGERRPEVNNVEIAEGNYFSNDNAREVLLSTAFAEYHNFIPGDWVILKIASHEVLLRLTGIVNSPEYLQVSKSPQEPLPSPHNFGIAFLPAGKAEKLFNMRGMANEIVLRVNGEAEDSVVLGQVQNILKDYGVGRVESQAEPASLATRKMDAIRGLSTARLISLEDQPGHRLLKMSLDMFSQLALIFPLFFLILSALTTYVLLSRLITAQRPQIGVLKSLGYSKNQVLGHYLAYGSIMGLAGSILGALAGLYLQGVFSVQFANTLRIPSPRVEANLPLLAIVVFFGSAVSIVASYVSARKTINMRPAESMRPPSPGGSQRPLLERLAPIPAWLPLMAKYPLYHLPQFDPSGVGHVLQ
jgi:putative ABC transport system permease protein